MQPLSYLKKINLEKIIYLSIAASPGGLKIFTLAIIGILSHGNLQGEVANDLAITAFLLMLTAIGAGTQILHLIPKESNSSKLAAEIFKSLLTKLTLYIAAICITLYLLDNFLLNVLHKRIETSLLLFFSSIYWIIRHYYLARSSLKSLLIVEIITWSGTAIALTALSITNKLDASNIILSISAVYLLSVTGPVFTLLKYSSNKETKIIADATSIGFSNLASGGVINLAPSICFHVSGPATAGVVGLITNIASIALTIIRAYLLKKIPEISNSISGSSELKFTPIFNNARLTTRKITIMSFCVLQPVAIATTIATQGELGIYSITLYSVLITAFICTPQLCAVESVIINYFGRSKIMLLTNLAHATLTVSLTYASYLAWGESPKVFFTFLASSILLYIFRNQAIKNIVTREIQARKIS